MNFISESELADAVKNRTVTHLQIAQHGHGKYRVVINLSSRPGDWHLVTNRRTPHEFASLDRLVNLIERHWGGIPDISLSFFRPLDSEVDDHAAHHCLVPQHEEQT